MCEQVRLKKKKKNTHVSGGCLIKTRTSVTLITSASVVLFLLLGRFAGSLMVSSLFIITRLVSCFPTFASESILIHVILIIFFQVLGVIISCMRHLLEDKSCGEKCQRGKLVVRCFGQCQSHIL